MPTLDRKFEKLNKEYFINNKDSIKNLLKIKYKKIVKLVVPNLVRMFVYI